MGPVAKLLPDGTRLHLQHGPIDLIIGADGQRDRAFQAATDRFATVLEELTRELPALRAPLTRDTPYPAGAIARRMHVATQAHCAQHFVTRMAAVAGAVADEVLQAMTATARLDRAYVNNGGDIALHLTGGARFRIAAATHAGQPLGMISLTSADPVRGIATSGRHGRSLSLGIADSVTVLAVSAAQADVAATLIANSVDLPGHTAISRKPADALVDDSDLGTRPVVVGCGALSAADCQTALDAGTARAAAFQSRNLIAGAALALQDQVAATQTPMLTAQGAEPLCA